MVFLILCYHKARKKARLSLTKYKKYAIMVIISIVWTNVPIWEIING